MKIKASFLSVEETPPVGILSFAQDDSFSGCKSLILMRTKEYEVFKYEFERGVSISWNDDEEDYFDEIITSAKRRIEVDLSEITEDESKDMEQIVSGVNSD